MKKTIEEAKMRAAAQDVQAAWLEQMENVAGSVAEPSEEAKQRIWAAMQAGAKQRHIGVRVIRRVAVAAAVALVCWLALDKSAQATILSWYEKPTLPIEIDRDLLTYNEKMEVIDMNGNNAYDLDLSGLTPEELEAYWAAVAAFQQDAIFASQLLNGANASRAEYAGCYIYGDKLNILLTDIDEKTISWYTKRLERYADKICFIRVQNSLNELILIEEEAIEAFQANGVPFSLAGISEKYNCVRFGIEEDDWDKAAAVITENGWLGKVRLSIAGPEIPE